MDTKPFKPFKPLGDPQGRPSTKAAILSVIIGSKRKARFREYCELHRMGQTKMIKQMIDHCIENSQS